ncbi:MAG: anhydro-N-acetylmuramic acid kinase [Gammaproteobacteria bacterium]|nr:anhydro-N-acetylmuramic acid kinase [Gammaproteobacteria bacterium]
MPKSNLFIGLMSGTSMDGIDAVLVDFSNATPTLISHTNTEFSPQLRERLLALCSHGEVGEMAELDVELGLLFSIAAKKVIDLAKISTKDIRAIGSHGQTVRHHPENKTPYTLQIADPNIIAEKTGLLTVADFRRHDIAAGGQGAPLVPAFHNAVFRSYKENRAIINIGGMANVTILPSKADQNVTGFDTGPGNVLMDSWIYQRKGKLIDKDGQWAASGQIHKKLLSAMISDPYFKCLPPKSTGREYFNIQWLEHHLGAQPDTIPEENIQATLCELTTISIAEALTSFAPDRVLLCGGGIHNKTLYSRLRHHIKCTVQSSETLNISPDWMEAIAFAWLARQRLDEKPGNIPAVTGARHPAVLGGVYSPS